ncbi:TetR/AcrR family transcriptional regulator [Chitinophaga sp. GCM10012297]|uniref:TetR/AcrR family transcriptional regulator n=1 Tax=Chitinophaga chungangae TaxID=2821488 RepID=A0ABS3YE70_9BACT|nr:TetR/AcrR family transcriptional regulator [Chitinophaga chungangae]MBO9152958.1 TetR/AcrR family transcriptional regulator [Chitinophaga chungangae]
MHTENRDEMRERIIEAALKRFTHYGASKTTMNEIADDLHCSKASLYYYFPDKHALHLAVLEKAGEMYFQEIEQSTAEAPNAEAALLDMIPVRQNFARKFCRLELFKVLKDKQLLNSDETFRLAREKETAIVAGIIRKGVAGGELVSDNPDQVAALYIQSMIGLRLSLSTRELTDEISEEEFETVRQWQVQLADIFIKGLKS